MAGESGFGGMGRATHGTVLVASAHASSTQRGLDAAMARFSAMSIDDAQCQPFQNARHPQQEHEHQRETHICHSPQTGCAQCQSCAACPPSGAARCAPLAGVAVAGQPHSPERLYTQREVEGMTGEIASLRVENQHLIRLLREAERTNHELLARSEKAMQLEEKLKAAEYTNYALSVRLSAFNRPGSCA
ncbi:unnamed protein product [Phaeothamnion confervicola]